MEEILGPQGQSDLPQLPVRVRALQEGKLLYMAVPRLAGPFPFLMLDPTSLKVSARRAASIRGSAATGEAVVLETMVPIDLIVCGSVAVNPHGSASGREEATPTSSSPW